MKQASYEATGGVLAVIDLFLENLTKLPDRVSASRKARESSKLTAKDAAKDEGSEDAGLFRDMY